MITQVMPNAQNIQRTTSKAAMPSFGFAKLNELGKETADSFGYQHNKFLNDGMFKKQGLFQKSLLSVKLAKGENFAELCKTYGCDENGRTNAAFIKNQILTSKSSAALSRLKEQELSAGLVTLYYGNYDNPQLSTKETRELLELVRDYIEPEDYIKHVGILTEGTVK